MFFYIYKNWYIKNIIFWLIVKNVVVDWFFWLIFWVFVLFFGLVEFFFLMVLVRGLDVWGVWYWGVFFEWFVGCLLDWSFGLVFFELGFF